jgi:hypothetical protein
MAESSICSSPPSSRVSRSAYKQLHDRPTQTSSITETAKARDYRYQIIHNHGDARLVGARRQLSVLLATTTRSASQRCFLVLLPTRLQFTRFSFSYTNEPCRTPCFTRLLVSTCRVRACFGRPSRFTTGDGCGFDGSRPSTRWNLHARDEMDETRRVAG